MLNNNITEDQPVFSIIQRIKDGSLNPNTLSQEIRQQCAEVLLARGYEKSDIAQILGRSEKTIQRDLKAIREKNKLEPSIEFAKEIIGDMVHKARIHHAHLMRFAQTKEASVAEKAQSEFLAWRIVKELVEKLQSSGYLPLRAQGATEVLLEEDKGKSLEEIRNMVSEIEAVAKERDNNTPQMQADIAALKSQIEKAEIVEKTNSLKEKCENLDNKEVQNVK